MPGSVTNTGNVTLDPIEVTDPMFGGVVDCGTGPLAPGQTRTCPALTYTLTAADIGGDVTNAVTATGTPPDPETLPPTDGDEVITPVPATPAILLEKSAGALNDVDGNGADAGDTIRYTFVVTNVGNVTLDSVTVTDPMFAGMFPGGVVPCGSGPLAVGESRTCDPVDYAITAAQVGTTLTNTATATGSPAGGTSVSSTDLIVSPIPAAPPVIAPPTATTPPPVPLPPNSQPPATDPVVLPRTGGSSTGTLTIAALILAAGLAVLLLARMRRRLERP